MVGIEDADAEGALKRDQHQRDGQHRRAEHHEEGGRIVRPDEERQAEPGHAWRAHAVRRDDEVQPGKDGTETGDEDAHRCGDDMGVQVVRAERRGEGPAGIDATQNQRGDGEDAGHDIQVPAQQVHLGEGEIAGAHHDGQYEIPDGRRDGRHQEQEDHDDAVHGEQLVVGVRGNQVRHRRQQLKPDQTSEGAAEKEEEGDRDQIEHRDPLMVAGEQPALQTILAVQIAALGQRCILLVGKTDDCTHCGEGPIPFEVDVSGFASGI